jgi:ribosomal protein S18 acetylase RimI-like enzyme
MAPTFRQASVADLEVLTTFIRELYTLEHIAFEEGRVRLAVSTLLEDPQLGRVWLITDRGEPVGYLALTLGYSLEYGGRDAFIDELFIRESHRGRGLGRRALRVAEEACRELDVRALHLEVARTNAAAKRLYRASGFVDHDRYLMTKQLPTR